MARGVPAIATDVGALVTQDRTGLRVPPENSGVLAEAILNLIKDPDHARRLGQGARALIQRDFDPQAEVDSLVGVYGQVLDAAPPVSTYKFACTTT